MCAETPAGPTGLVVFGASGDLANRKLYPSLYRLHERQLLGDRFYLIGCGRTPYSDHQFRRMVSQSLGIFLNAAPSPEFLSRLYYVSGQYDSAGLYESIRERMMELDEQYRVEGARIFYLSTPPSAYRTIIELLQQTRLSCPAASGCLQNIRIVIEKPFGNSQQSAEELNAALRRCFDESQIFRIDHYLGKDTVQNLLVLRFANILFEPLWNRNYISRVEITLSESVGIEHRAGYYEQSGAIRDMLQNHILQLLALVAMEPPSSFDAESIRDEKAKLLRCLTPLTESIIENQFVFGQYAQGQIGGQTVCGYRQEQGVDPQSGTETFVAAKLTVDNWRWKGVPFYIRTGKRLSRKLTEIVITFNPIPHSMFVSAGLDSFEPNVLRFQIQPQEGVFLKIQAKQPGSKSCIRDLDLAVNFQQAFGQEMPEAYQRLLLDCMLGDQTLFTRQDSVRLSWQWVEPIFQYWENNPQKLLFYPAGTSSDELSAPIF